MSGILTLAHLSDVHLPPLPRLPIGQANLKRVLGFLNWYRRRKSQHSAGVLQRVVDDLRAQAPDHIAVTGDLVNIGLPAEYEAALGWLERFDAPNRISVVPGNHDIYVELGGDPGVRRWQRYMTGSDAAVTGFPYLRKIGHVALIGLNSAVPTPPFYAFGRLGAAQIDALDRLLYRLGQDGLVRVVLIHHPPLPGQASPKKALLDAEALAGVLRVRGVELVLHGHNHRAMAADAGGTACTSPVIGVPSASMRAPHGEENLARYNLYRITTDPKQPIELIERGIERADGPVVEIGRRLLVRAGERVA